MCTLGYLLNCVDFIDKKLIMKYLLQVWILLISCSPIALAGVCNNCQYEIVVADSFCPNCGSWFSLQSALLTDATLADSFSRLMPSQSIATTSMGGYGAVPDISFTLPTSSGFIKENSASKNSYDNLKKLLNNARKERRNVDLWNKVNEFCQESDRINDLYYLYARAVALRNMGYLDDALSVLNLSMTKKDFNRPGNYQRVQIHYELSFIYYLREDHSNAIFYYYLFLTNREEHSITNISVNNAIHSALQVLAQSPNSVNAWDLLIYCWNNLKNKIDAKRVSAMTAHGFI